MNTTAVHTSLGLKLMILGRRKPGTTLAEHRRHIRQVHGELVLGYIAHDSAAAPRRYVQNVVLDGTYRGTDPAVDKLALQRDFVTQIWFADFPALARSRETDFYNERLKGDEDNFVDQETVVFVPTREHEVRSGTVAGGGIKLLAMVQRAPGAAPQDFQRAWSQAALALQAPGIRRHVQNEVLGPPGAPLPLHGIDEFWLDSEAEAQALLAQWRDSLQAHLVEPALVAPDTLFLLIVREDVLHAGPG